MARHGARRASQRTWDLVIEATVIITSTIIASLIIAIVLHTPGA
ncbi:MAG: hypothetical protein ACYDFT_00285 [Thermoplasmata archaeon]